jgi:hypothetical protein
VSALVPVADNNALLPVFSGQQMAAALTAYRELQHALDAAMPDQIMQLDGKPFRKKGYWRAVSVAFNLTVEPIEERREQHGDTYVYVVTYRATAASGRFAIGDGACSSQEKTRGRMQATEHNVRGHAHTRAYNRAVSNLVGFGEVSAEEARDEQPAEPVARIVPHRVAPAAAAPDGYDRWLLTLTAMAGRGTAPLMLAWNDSPLEYRRRIANTNRKVWDALKAKAASCA